MADHLLSDMPILDGTPSSFPIGETELIGLAKKVQAAKGGVEDPSLLADDFRFEFPIIKLDKKKYLGALKQFKFEETFPDIQQAAYLYNVDPYEPNRVWFFIRAKGTHRKTLNLGGTKFPATNKSFRAPPQVHSYTFNEQGKVTSLTGGYVVDNRVGNTGGLGGLFGIMVGVGLPKPGSFSFFVRVAIIRLFDLVNLLTLGLSNKVLKRD